jgi:hypothetical protein
VIVARTRSRFGGRLDCGHEARRGDLIFKADVGDRGRQTSGKNGRGAWLCAACAAGIDNENQPA